MSLSPVKWHVSDVYPEGRQSLLTYLVEQVVPTKYKSAIHCIQQTIKELNHRDFTFTTHSSAIVKALVDESVLPYGHVITEKVIKESTTDSHIQGWQLEKAFSIVACNLAIYETKKAKTHSDDGRFVLFFGSPDNETLTLSGVLYRERGQDDYTYYGDMLIYRRLMIAVNSKMLASLRSSERFPTTWGVFKEACLADGILNDNEITKTYDEAFRDEENIWLEKVSDRLFWIVSKDTWRKEYAKPHDSYSSVAHLASLSGKEVYRILATKAYLGGYLDEDGYYYKPINISGLYGDYA